MIAKFEPIDKSETINHDLARIHCRWAQIKRSDHPDDREVASSGLWLFLARIASTGMGPQWSSSTRRHERNILELPL